MTTGKTIALTGWTFVGKIMSLFFNMLSRLVITFLPRSKRLLISWLQSPSAVILELKKIKSNTVSPSVYHEVMGPDAMTFMLEEHKSDCADCSMCLRGMFGFIADDRVPAAVVLTLQGCPRGTGVCPHHHPGPIQTGEINSLNVCPKVDRPQRVQPGGLQGSRLV